MTSTGMFTIVQLKGMLYMSTASSPQKKHCLEDTPNIDEVYKEFLLASLLCVCVCVFVVKKAVLHAPSYRLH